MSDSKIKSGIYIFYSGYDSSQGQPTLYRAHYDGQSVDYSNQPWTAGTGMPKVVGAPCALYDSTGSYAGDGLPRIHVFVPVDGGVIWWLSTTDGRTVIVHSHDAGPMRATYKPSAILYGSVICLFYAAAGTGTVSQAQSTGGWSFGTPSPVQINGNSYQAIAGCAATVRNVPNIAFGQGGDPSSGAAKVFFCLNFTTQNPSGNSWTDASPSIGNISRTPGLSVLGDQVVMTSRVWGNDAGLYAQPLTDGGWGSIAQITDAWTTNSPGSCVWGDRLYCFFQANSGGTLYGTAYVGGAWMPKATLISGPNDVWWGPCAVAVGA